MNKLFCFVSRSTCLYFDLDKMTKIYNSCVLFFFKWRSTVTEMALCVVLPR